MHNCAGCTSELEDITRSWCEEFGLEVFLDPPHRDYVVDRALRCPVEDIVTITLSPKET